VAIKDANLKAKADDWLLGLHPLGRIAIGIVPAILLVVILEALWVQPGRQSLHLLSLQEHAQQIRLNRYRHEVQENAHLKAQAIKTRKRLLHALTSLQDQDSEGGLEVLDRVLSQAGIILTEEPSIVPTPEHGSPLTLNRFSSSIEASYPGLVWALTALALQGLPFSIEELTLKPLQAPKPDELVREETLTGKIGLIQVIAHPDLIQDFPEESL
jgi:hypothetical protein